MSNTCLTCANAVHISDAIIQCRLTAEYCSFNYSCTGWQQIARQQKTKSKKTEQPIKDWILKQGRLGMKINIVNVVKGYFGGKGYYYPHTVAAAKAIEELVNEGKLQEVKDEQSIYRRRL